MPKLLIVFLCIVYVGQAISILHFYYLDTFLTYVIILSHTIYVNVLSMNATTHILLL